MNRSADDRARRTAALHAGMIHRSELRTAGLSDRQIQTRVRRGDLIRQHPAVYRIAGAPLTFVARVWGALLACGPRAFASHWTAALLWGMRRREPDVIDITVRGRHRRELDGVRVHLDGSGTAQVRRAHAVPAGSPGRTVCELAATASRTDVEHAVQEAAARRLLRPAGLQSAAADWGARRGARMLRSILQADGQDELTRAWTERRLRWMLQTAHLPLPRHTNLVILGHRCDAVWPERRLIVEVDGIETHGTPVAFAADRRMDAELTVAGWRVLRFTARQLHDEPLVVVAQMAVALARAAR